MAEHVFTFELVRHYPYVRSYILKKPLKRPVTDVISELFTGRNR
jgi:hypothetical protein